MKKKATRKGKNSIAHHSDNLTTIKVTLRKTLFLIHSPLVPNTKPSKRANPKAPKLQKAARAKKEKTLLTGPKMIGKWVGPTRML